MRGVMKSAEGRVRVSCLHEGEGGNQDGCVSLGVELGAEVVKGADLFFGGDAGDDVACEAAGQDGQIRTEGDGHHDIANDGGESVAVVEAKWSCSMTAAAEIDSFIKGHFKLMRRLPHCFCRFVAIRRGFMKGVFGAAQERVLSGHKLPRVGGKPSALKGHRSGFSFGGFLGFSQFGNADAFQKAFACFAVNGFRRKTVLDREGVGHHAFKDRIIQKLGINLCIHSPTIQDIRFQINSSILTDGWSAYSIRN